MAQPFDTGDLQITGDVYPVAEGMSLANGNNYAPISVSEDGLLLYWTGGSGCVGGQEDQMVWYDRAGKAEPVGGGHDIWLRDLERGNERRLTTDPSSNVSPVWSPTGDRIAFRSNRNGSGDLYVRASSGSGQDERILATPNSKGADQWSADGRFLVYHEADPIHFRPVDVVEFFVRTMDR